MIRITVLLLPLLLLVTPYLLLLLTLLTQPLLPLPLLPLLPLPLLLFEEQCRRVGRFEGLPPVQTHIHVVHGLVLACGFVGMSV
jgi:hypothetical protein